jgi:integrase
VSGRLSFNEAFAARGRRAPRSQAGSGRIEAAAPTASTSGADPSVDQLVSAYLDYANAYYVKDGRSTSEAGNIQKSFEPVCELYGHTPAREFGPLRLKIVRKVMITSGLCRNEINRRVRRIVRAFQWAVGEELIPVSTYDAPKSVPLLRPGQGGVRESQRTGPVPDAFVEAVQPYVSRQVWAMIQLQRLTGMRPGEVRTMRTIDVDTSGPVWVYTPQAHHTRIYGYERKIYLGPQAQEVLRPWLRADPTAFLFQPREAMAEYRAGLRRGRRSPAQSPRRQGRYGGRRAGEMYSPQSYRHAISAGIAKANREAERTRGARIPRWRPHQLRHSAATRLRREFGLDVASAVLGYRSAVVAPVYAERDVAKAVEAVARIG